jgi:putative ABC transport system permease protein
MWRLIARSLVYYRRTHAAVVAGAAIATAVLVGALLVGASVRHTLARQAELRIGSLQHVLVAGDRFFDDDLGSRLGDDRSGGFAPVILVPGTAVHPATATRVSDVQVLGIDERFAALGPTPSTIPLRDGELAINTEAAQRLGAAVGDDLVLRIDAIGGMPRDAALASSEQGGVTIRLRVGRVVDDASFGRFSLVARPEPVLNVFLPRERLAAALDKPGKANMLLTSHAWSGRELASPTVREVLRLSDFELSLRDVDGGRELVSDRVFLDPEVAAAVTRLAPEALQVLSYFVNSLRHDDRATPYSMVAALSQPNPLFTDVRDDQIVINDWLAEDLGATVGDAIELRYFIIDEANRLTETSATFTVAKVVAMAGLAGDATLMPAFPGLHDAENCRDWTPGVPVDLDRIRDTDEAYWDQHRGTPKAIVTLAAGQRMWANRFGDLTAVRLSEDVHPEQIVAHLDAARMGLSFVDVRTPALAAASGGTDFASLFLGLSCFLIVAALLLTALLFAFNLEQRASETGLLSAVGWSASHVRWLMLAEAILLATAGGAIGAVLGVGFTAAVLRLLATVWRGAVAGTAIELATPAATIAWGVAAGVAATLLSLTWVARRMSRVPIVRLLGGDTAEAQSSGRGRWVAILMAVLCGAGAVAMLTVVPGLGAGGQARANAFFAAGGLLLASGVAAMLAMLSGSTAASSLSMASLAWRGTTRRRGRSLAVAGLMACGLFLVLAVGATQLQPPRDPTQRDSGTGGFALYGSTALPLLHDLNTARGRDAVGLDEDDFVGASVVPLRVRDGDDASCLNLNRAQRPRLVGVDPVVLADRGAFTFITPGATWRVLDEDLGPHTLPGVADRNTLMWGLGAKVGDVVHYTGERGEPLDVRIVAAIDNSILQGELIIAERAFVERYPSVSGWRMLLIDADAHEADRLTATLGRAMEDLGLSIVPTVERLAAFNAVENTYRMVFASLGALGLLLGSVAVGAVVLRNTLERRGELAILAAVGFTPGRVRRLVVLEHAVLVAAGVAVGVVAAAVAAAGGGVFGAAGVGLILAVTGSAMAWVWLVTWAAVRGPLIEALRKE